MNARRRTPGQPGPGVRRLSGASRFCLGAVIAVTAILAQAHRGHAVWTDITWNGKGFEIVHRLHLADAITIQRSMGDAGPIESLRSQALVALYVEDRFTLLVDGERTTPATIGAEIEDDFLLVYQEWRAPLPEDRFPDIDNRILLDVEPGAQAFMVIEGPAISEERERL